MDGSRFDAWTRRRFGLAAGVLSASLPGLASLVDAEAKKKRKKKCKKLGQGCKPGGKKKKCCKGKGLSCEPPPMTGGNRCCLIDGQPCATDGECCSAICLDDECQPTFCKELGQGCATGEQCCSGACNGTCQEGPM